MEATEIGARFVSSYYRLIYRNYTLLRKLYDPHAIVNRNTSKVSRSFQVCMQAQVEVCPFVPSDTVCKILNYCSYPVGDNIMISVYGTVTGNIKESCFSQQFLLREENQKWMIFSDTFYLFGPPGPDSFNPEFESSITQPGPRMQYPAPMFTSQPQLYPQSLPPQTKSAPITQSPSRTQSSAVPSSPVTKQRIDSFCKERSITVVNLPNNYNGAAVVSAFSTFGPITGQFYTHNTVYIEYEKDQMADNASLSNIPASLPVAHNTKVERGIVQRDPRGPYSRNKL